MPSIAHYRSWVILTLGAVAAHTYLAVLGILDSLNFTVPTRYPTLEQAANAHLWAWLHAAAAIGLLVALLDPCKLIKWLDSPRIVVASNIGFAIMLIWAFFNLLWGMSTIRPVSLAGPGLGLVVAIGELLLAHAWNRGVITRDR